MLHNLYPKQQTNNAVSQSDTAQRAKPVSTGTPEEWAGLVLENERLDHTARRMADKIESLRSKHEETRAKSAKYKQLLKEHIASQDEFIAAHQSMKTQLKKKEDENSSLKNKMQKLTDNHKQLNKELHEHKTAVAQVNAAANKYKLNLEKTAQELADIKAEMPEVQKLLKQGGEAHRKLQSMQNNGSKQVQELQRQIETLKKKAAEPDHILSSKSKHMESEITWLKDRLEAAGNRATVSSKQLQQCKDMLTKAGEILRACIDLHKGDSLAPALQTTTDNIEEFLATLRSK